MASRLLLLPLEKQRTLDTTFPELSRESSGEACSSMCSARWLRECWFLTMTRTSCKRRAQRQRGAASSPVSQPQAHIIAEEDLGFANSGFNSKWVIAIQRAGMDVLPSIINAVILSSAACSGNALLHVGSRYLYALAELKQAPKILLKCSKK